jgi:ribonuclease HII
LRALSFVFGTPRSRDSLLRQRYVIEGRPLETSLEKMLRADEGGTSPRGGPVSAAAVILKPGTRITGIDGSKKVGANSREALAIEIKEKAASWVCRVCRS